MRGSGHQHSDGNFDQHDVTFHVRRGFHVGDDVTIFDINGNFFYINFNCLFMLRVTSTSTSWTASRQLTSKHVCWRRQKWSWRREKWRRQRPTWKTLDPQLMTFACCLQCVLVLCTAPTHRPPVASPWVPSLVEHWEGLVGSPRITDLLARIVRRHTCHERDKQRTRNENTCTYAPHACPLSTHTHTQTHTHTHTHRLFLSVSAAHTHHTRTQTQVHTYPHSQTHTQAHTRTTHTHIRGPSIMKPFFIRYDNRIAHIITKTAQAQD